MICPARRTQPAPPLARLFLSALAVVALLASVAAANDAQPGDADDLLGSRQAMLKMLGDVQRKYGVDAVMLEGQLLGVAVHSGSILEAEVSVPGFEERNGKRFLIFTVETGIVYNDRELSAHDRPARVWSDMVETSLRKFHTMTLPADGIALRFTYLHRPYADESELREHLRDAPGTAEAVVFYLLLPDATELMANHITGQQLIDRSLILVNDAPAHVVLPAPAPSPTP